MPDVPLSNRQITAILIEEDLRLQKASPRNEHEARELRQAKEAVKVIKILHAKSLAEAKDDKEILAQLQAEFRWAEEQLAGNNFYLNTSSPDVFCRRILARRGQRIHTMSVEEALRRLSGQKNEVNERHQPKRTRAPRRSMRM
jgi:hypothetical protein